MMDLGRAAPAELAARIDATLDLDALVGDCQAAVQIPSPSGEEAAVARSVSDLLGRLGFDEVGLDPKGNVVGILRGAGGGRSLMINGHLDHVPPGDMPDPFSGAVVDASRWGEQGKAIYGRGTCDMKCNVIASAHAVGTLRRAGVRLAEDLVFVADVGEEVDSPEGVASVLAGGVRADAGLSTESTRQRVHLGHRGKLDVEYVLRGRTAHASEPRNGVNVLDSLPALLGALQTYGGTLPDDALLGAATVAAFLIHTEPDNGTAVIPDRCRVRVDRRYVRGEQPASVVASLRAAARRALLDLPTPWDLTVVTHYPLMFTEPDSSIACAASDARADAVGLREEAGAWRFGVNGTFMAAAGIPTIGLGPGDERWAHTPDEHVLVSDLEQAARIWTRLLVRWCGLAEEGRA